MTINHAVLCALLVGGLAAGCGDDSDGTTNAESTTLSAPEVSSEPFKIGIIVEETGNAASFGEPTIQGYKTALAQLAETSSHKFEVVTCDGGSSPELALACYDRLVGREDVQALIGPGISASAQAITPKVVEDKLLNYVQAGGFGGRSMGGNPTQFGGNVTYTDAMTAIWSWAEKDGIEDVYVISTADASAQGCRDFLEDSEFEEVRGSIEILGHDEMAIDAQSAAPQMAKVPAEADLLMLCGSGGAGVVMAKSYAQAGLEMPIMMAHTQALPQVEAAMAGLLPDGKAFVPAHCPTAAAKDELEEGYACTAAALEYAERLRGQFPDAVPSLIDAGVYDAVIQLASAVEAVGSETDAIREWLESQTELPGANGVYEFGRDQHRGLGPESMLMAVWRDDSWHLESMNDMPKA